MLIHNRGGPNAGLVTLLAIERDRWAASAIFPVPPIGIERMIANSFPFAKLVLEACAGTNVDGRI